MDPVVLSYHDSLLHRSDLELLNEGQWLNDRLIGFMYEYFEREVFKELASRGFALFVNPSTVQYLKLCSSLDEAKMCFLEPLEMNNRDVIFFPLNNNNRVNVAGGSHWSLAVLLKSTRSLIHFDSTGSNESEARTFFDKFKSYFLLENFSTDPEFPKQSNSSDCGVFLLGLFYFFLYNQN